MPRKKVESKKEVQSKKNELSNILNTFSTNYSFSDYNSHYEKFKRTKAVKRGEFKEDIPLTFEDVSRKWIGDKPNFITVPLKQITIACK